MVYSEGKTGFLVDTLFKEGKLKLACQISLPNKKCCSVFNTMKLAM